MHDNLIDIEALQDAVERLAGAATGRRPTFAIPWTDTANATPIADIAAVIVQIQHPDDAPLRTGYWYD